MHYGFPACELMFGVIKQVTELHSKNIRLTNMDNTNEPGYSLQEDNQLPVYLKVNQLQLLQVSSDHGPHLLPEEHLPQSRQLAGHHPFQNHSQATQQHYLKASFLKKLL